MKTYPESRLTDLLIEFDEMGFCPTAVCPSPEQTAIEWKEQVVKEIQKLQAENAELRERLDKAVEEVDKVRKIIEPTMYTSFCGFVVRWCTLMEHKELYGTQEAAEAKLKEIKEDI